ncbi:hypothetical protein [Clostridium sp.]|uniref:hypothetical protein n=1 Tax=Clostridium sp. TaxID=1506 RepID=UPI003217F769
MDKAKKIKDELEIEIGQLHREVMGKNIPLIIIFQGKYTSDEKKVINSMLTIMDYRVTNLYTDNDKKIHINNNDKVNRVKKFWMNIPRNGHTSVFYTKDYFGFMSNDKDIKYIKLFEKSLIEEGYVIIKFIFNKSRNKIYKNNIEFIKKFSEDENCFKHINLDCNNSIIKTYEELINELTRVINKSSNVNENVELKLNEDIAKSTRVKEDLKYVENSEIEKEKAIVEFYKNNEEDILDIKKIRRIVDPSIYSKRIKELERSMCKLQKQLIKKNKALVIVYEGWDAAGKGGNIKRVVKNLDPIRYKVVPISAPNEEERAHHYMWRFWRWIPRSGNITIFDRSWYGRVLVEQVEGLCEPWKWEKSYAEINLFEKYITESNCILIKIFINISNDEQLRRFNKRKSNPLKAYKITDEDWRNREKWNKYENAINKCISKTSKDYNPWLVINGNFKYNARIEALEYICKILKDNL